MELEIGPELGTSIRWAAFWLAVAVWASRK